MPVTVPLLSAVTSFSIFIASSTSSVSPSETFCPTVTEIFSILPGMGALTALPSPDGAGAGALSCLGAGADTAAGAGEAASYSLSRTALPSSTSTSYTLLFKVILYFIRHEPP